MPVNVTQGSTIVFTVEFFSSAGILTVPTSATLTITYPALPNGITTTSCAIGMSASNNFFTASWGSAMSALGIVSYSISAAGQASPTTGTLRVIS